MSVHFRRAWRRRCKSTSNLANLPGGDSSDSTDGETTAPSAAAVVKTASGTTVASAAAANANVKTKKAIKMALAAAAAAAAGTASATSGDKGTSSLQGCSLMQEFTLDD